MSEEKLCCLKSGPVSGLFAQVATVLHHEIVSFRPPLHSGYGKTLPPTAHNEVQATVL